MLVIFQLKKEFHKLCVVDMVDWYLTSAPSFCTMEDGKLITIISKLFCS